MSPFWITIAILALAALGYLLGRSRSVRLAGGDTRALHSRPTYHGWHVALFTALPALVLLALTRLLQAPGWPSRCRAPHPSSAPATWSSRSCAAS